MHAPALALVLALPTAALAGDVTPAGDTSTAPDRAVRAPADRAAVAVDVSVGVTALRPGTPRDTTGPGASDLDVRRAFPGGVVALGAEGPRRRGVEVIGIVTGALREQRGDGPPVFGATVSRPTRAAVGLGPRGHMRAAIDGALGPRVLDLFASVGPVAALGVTASGAWASAWPPHLRLGVHGSVALSTPLGGGVELHTAWRSLILADVTGATQRRNDPWHLGLLTVGLRVPIGPDAELSPGSSPSPR